MAHKIIRMTAAEKREFKRNEFVPAFMERCAVEAQKIGGSVDAGMGPLCSSCAPFGGAAYAYAEILPHASCYNCNDK